MNRRSYGRAAVAMIAVAGLLPLQGFRVAASGRAQGPVASVGVNVVTIDPSRVSAVLAPTFFGLNSVGFWDSAQGSTASAVALAQTPIRAVRFPGGAPADWYDWQDPTYKSWSSTSPLKLWQWARQLGPQVVPLFQTNYQGNLPNPPG
jgi:hypothetical protein